MIVDTNVLLRALDRDAGRQGRAVRTRIEAAREPGSTLTVLSATVLEVAYVLESARAGYGWGRDAIARAVEASSTTRLSWSSTARRCAKRQRTIEPVPSICTTAC